MHGQDKARPAIWTREEPPLAVAYLRSGSGWSPAGFRGRPEERQCRMKPGNATGGSKLSRGHRHCFTTSPRSSRMTPERLAGPLLLNVENRPLFLWTEEVQLPPSHSTTSDASDSETLSELLETKDERSQIATAGPPVRGYVSIAQRVSESGSSTPWQFFGVRVLRRGEVEAGCLSTAEPDLLEDAHSKTKCCGCLRAKRNSEGLDARTRKDAKVVVSKVGNGKDHPIHPRCHLLCCVHHPRHSAKSRFCENE